MLNVFHVFDVEKFRDIQQRDRVTEGNPIENVIMIRAAVFAKFCRVTDRRTDGQRTIADTALCRASRDQQETALSRKNRATRLYVRHGVIA